MSCFAYSRIPLLHIRHKFSANLTSVVRAWNSATGKELFRMDSFSDPIHSLCLLDGGFVDTATNTMLITDGMDKYVCVHDFSSNDDEADFDLEMPEYLNE